LGAVLEKHRQWGEELPQVDAPEIFALEGRAASRRRRRARRN